MTTRRTLAGFWLLTLAIALFASYGGDGRGLFFSWIQAVVLLFVTAAAAKTDREERLVHPILYRGVAATLLVVSLAGVVLGLLPTASGTSELFAAYFGLLAVLAYVALVARGPRRALWAVVVALFTWLPLMFFTLVGCRRGRIEQHWTEVSSETVLQIAMFLLPVLAAAALVAFQRREAMPEARVV